MELHSVIAELTRQLEQRAREKIDEEEEEEAAEEEEEVKKEKQRQTSDLASRTSTDIIDAEAVEAGERIAEQFGGGADGSAFAAGDFSFVKMRAAAAAAAAATASTVSSRNSTASLQVFAIQEELADAKERNIQLTARYVMKSSRLWRPSSPSTAPP